MADSKISQLIQRTPNGQEYLEVIIPPFTAGTNRKVLLSDIIALVAAQNDLDLATTSTAGGTITLDMNSQVQRMFVGSTSFGTAKAIALSNDTDAFESAIALVFNLVLTLTNAAAVLTFPISFTMQDSRWNDVAHTFTPIGTGKHEFSATWDGTDWNLKATYPYS